jgi:hypothetical protein
MKVSVSITGEDVAFDRGARRVGVDARVLVHRGVIEMLRAEELGGAYGDAWKEWAGSGEACRWDAVAGDGG